MEITHMKAYWKVHTPALLKEILSNPSAQILEKPLMIFSRILGEVADRAGELNDPILNDLMMRLTMYEIADPESPDFDQKIVDEVSAEAKRFKAKRA